MSSQVVDTVTAKELMEEALKKISEEDLKAILLELQQKSERFQVLLAHDSLPRLEEAQLRDLFKSIFSTRRKTGLMVNARSIPMLKYRIAELLHGGGRVEQRFNTFCGSFPSLDERIRSDLASELLHFTNPERYWLWTKWMWDPKTKTGALPLVVMTDFDLHRDTPGETYLRVGEAVVFVTAVGEAAGYQKIGGGLFGTDVYLALVYGIYIYTVLKMRMTQEFNQFIPQLPEMVRRLLGVYRNRHHPHVGTAANGREQRWA